MLMAVSSCAWLYTPWAHIQAIAYTIKYYIYLVYDSFVWIYKYVYCICLATIYILLQKNVTFSPLLASKLTTLHKKASQVTFYAHL